ncbi:MAG: hypothetical protein ACT4NP_00195 [Pseudonocardiales bacterium]
MPPPQQPLDIDQLREELKAARRRGVPASRLKTHAPGVIELLYPRDSYPELSIHQRAMAAESLIVAAIREHDGETGNISAVLFGVDPATSHLLLKQRREIVADKVGVLPDTWQRGWREQQLLSDLASIIYRLYYNGPHTYIFTEPA